MALVPPPETSPLDHSLPPGGGGGVGEPAVQGGSNPIGQGDEHEIPNTVMHNNRYDKACCKSLRDHLGPMRNVIKRTKASVLDLLLYSHKP